MEQSFASRFSQPNPNLDISQISHSTRDANQRSLLDISVATISNKVSKIKDSLFSYFGVERISEPQDTRYEELLKYAQRIREEAAAFARNRKGRDETKILAIRNVENCYSTIPEEYFDETFEFTFPARRSALDTKLLLEGFLDQVDVTLFSLVNANFNKYMAPMEAIEAIDTRVQQTLVQIHQGRDILMRIENQFLYKAIKTRKMAYISHNLERLVSHLKYMRKVKDLPDQINQCIISRNCDYTTFSRLEHTLEEEKICSALPCLQNTSGRLVQMKEELRMFLVGLIESSLYRYVNGLMVYDKDKWRDVQLPNTNTSNDLSFNPDVTILNMTKMDFKQKEDIRDDPQLREELVELIKLCSTLEIGVGGFGRKLAERLENFSEGFQEDLHQFVLMSLGIQNNQHLDLAKCFENIEIKHYARLVLIYFGILKAAFEKLAYLHNFGNKSIGFQDVLEAFRLFLVEQIQVFMSLKKLAPDVDCQSFAIYISLIDYWIEAEEETPQLQLPILAQSKQQLVNLYLANFHEETISGELAETLQKETFAAIKIPSDYYVQFERLLNPNVAEESLMLENTFNTSTRNERRKRGDRTLEAKNETRFLNKVLSLNGQNYILCGSFLLLIEIMEEYGEMAASLKGVQTKIQEKILDVLGFYNDQTRRLLLGNQLIKHGVVKQVSLRHLCLLARVLSLLLLILGKLHFKEAQGKGQLEESIKSHINDICKEMSTVVVCNIDSQIQSLYQSGPLKNVLGISPPCSQSTRIIEVLRRVKETIVECWDINKAKQLLRPSLREVSELYFKKLRNEGKRGQQEISWCLTRMVIDLGQDFNDQLKVITLEPS